MYHFLAHIFPYLTTRWLNHKDSHLGQGLLHKISADVLTDFTAILDCILRQSVILGGSIKATLNSGRCELVVVVVLLFYVHGKHLRSCRHGQLT